MRTFEGLTVNQEAVFGQIAMGRDAGHNPRTVRALMARDLVGCWDEVLPGYPPTVVVRYFVPPEVHLRWCAWCAEVDEAFR